MYILILERRVAVEKELETVISDLKMDYHLITCPVRRNCSEFDS